MSKAHKNYTGTPPAWLGWTRCYYLDGDQRVGPLGLAEFLDLREESPFYGFSLLFEALRSQFWATEQATVPSDH